MGRSIRTAAIVQPVWTLGGRRTEGPDEDAFTLAAAALERLGATSPSLDIASIDLVGEFPPDVEWSVSEALGKEEIEIRRHPPGLPSLFDVLGNAAATQEGDSSTTAVVAADTSAGERPPYPTRVGGAAAAVLLAIGTGARIAGRGVRHHPVERRPDASRWIAVARRAAPGLSPGSSGTLGIIADAAAPVLLAEWRRAFPSMVPEVSPWAPERWGDLPAARGLLAIWEHSASAPPGSTILLAGIRPDRTDFLSIVADAPVEWRGPWRGDGPAVSVPEGPTFHPGAEVEDAVSEGAYLPRARYLESLPSRWRFEGERCRQCGATTFPRRGRCRKCGRTDTLEPVQLPTAGLTVEAVTTIHPGAQPTEFDPVVAAVGPYSVVLVRLGDGPRATLQVTDTTAGTLHVGDRVSTVLRRLYPMEGGWRYGRKAVPEPATA